MLRLLFFRFILPLIAFLILRAVLKSVWGNMTSSVAPHKDAESESPVSPGGELKKDPVCGTYVAVAASVTKMVDGKPLYFCSTSCRDRFAR